MNLSISHSKFFLKLFPVHIICNMLVISLLSYSYFGVYDTESRKTPLSYVSVLYEFIFTKETIDKSRFIYENAKVLEVLIQRYTNNLSSLIKEIDGKVLIIYLPYGEDLESHIKGAGLFEDIVNNLDAKDITFVDIFSTIFTDFETYRIADSDAHLSKKANKMVADLLVKDYFSFQNIDPSEYIPGSGQIDEIRCFFPPNLNSNYGTWSVRTNTQGCRLDEDISISSLQDKYRVILLGDSVAVPWGVDIESGFPSLIEKQIDNFFILNVGKNATPLKERENFIKKFKDSLQPDLVILQVQIGNILSYLFSVPWNTSNPSEAELEMEESIYSQLKLHLFILLLMNFCFCVIFYFRARPKSI